MSRDRLTDMSKRLSWLLRHAAPSKGIAMDAAGWVAVDDVLAALGLTRPELEQIVQENHKSRLELKGDRVRASQGHSRDGMPVTLDALEASWEEFLQDTSIWHGTSVEAVRGIARGGLRPGERTHVHLSEHLSSRVGKRAQVDVMLEVDPPRLRAAKIRVFRSPNGVLLARCVPLSCIIGLATVSPQGKRAEAMMRALLFGTA